MVLAGVFPCFFAEKQLSFPSFSQPSYRNPVICDFILGCPCIPTPPEKLEPWWVMQCPWLLKKQAGDSSLRHLVLPCALPAEFTPAPSQLSSPESQASGEDGAVWSLTVWDPSMKATTLIMLTLLCPELGILCTEPCLNPMAPQKCHIQWVLVQWMEEQGQSG